MVVRGFQGLRDLPSDAERLGNRDPTACNEVRKGRPFNELEPRGDARGANPGARVRRDVRVIQRSPVLRFRSKRAGPLTLPPAPAATTLPASNETLVRDSSFP